MKEEMVREDTNQGRDGTAVGTGQQNTNDIINNCAEATCAARYCADLSSGGYSDWFLPSIDELEKFYINRAVLPNFGFQYYWSSTETSNANYALVLNYQNGSRPSFQKEFQQHVVAMRYF